MNFFQKRAAVLMAACGVLLFAGSAFSQSPRGDAGCILDRCQDRPDRQSRPAPPSSAPEAEDSAIPGLPRRSASRGNTTVAPGAFDFYVLALSWSSGFCAVSGNTGARRQCATGADLGFVVHGLWPQNERGFPSDCEGSVRTPSRLALEGVRDLFPDDGLARYEWRKHGTCSGRSPTEFFRDVRAAREAIEIPAQFKDVREPVSMVPADILRAFTQANPRLRPGMLAVVCPKGMLQEVRICMSKDLREFRPCPEIAGKTCRGRAIMVPPIL
jgi:ribonuclease T2